MFHVTFSSSLKSYCLCSKLEASPFSLSISTYISLLQYNLSSFSQTWSNLAHSKFPTTQFPLTPQVAKTILVRGWQKITNPSLIIDENVLEEVFSYSFSFLCFTLLFFFFVCSPIFYFFISSLSQICFSLSLYVTAWLYFFVFSILVARDVTKTTT